MARMNTLPPGPAMPALLQLYYHSTNLLAFLKKCHARYGDCFTLRIPKFSPNVFFVNPEAIKEIYLASQEQIYAGEAVRPLLSAAWGENSTFVLDGDRHKIHRQLVAPLFNLKRMQAYFTAIRDLTDQMINQVPLNQKIPMVTTLNHVSLHVILQTLYGMHDLDRVNRLHQLVSEIFKLHDSVWFIPCLLMRSLQIKLGPLTPWQRLKCLMSQIDQEIYTAITERNAKIIPETEQPDVLSSLLAARDEAGNQLSHTEIRDELAATIGAGHRSITATLAWFLIFVLKNPTVYAQLKEELHRVVGADPVLPHHLDKLVYLQATIKETLRLSPPLVYLPRILKVPMSLGGIDLPANVFVTPCIYLMHHHPAFWPEPELFKPERFIEQQEVPYTLIPFGGGVRRCIGYSFSFYEIKIILAQLLSRTDLSIDPNYHYTCQGGNHFPAFIPAADAPLLVTARRYV